MEQRRFRVRFRLVWLDHWMTDVSLPLNHQNYQKHESVYLMKLCHKQTNTCCNAVDLS